MNFEQVITRRNLHKLFDYFAVFIIIFYAGKATVFVQALESWNHPIGFILPIITFAFVFFLKNVKFNHRYWFMIGGFTLYMVASTIKLVSCIHDFI